jgi:enoyl-CoA hydratase/carnithine racemase
MDEALEMAEGICQYSPYGVQMTKQVIWANLENNSLAAAIELEDRNQIMLGMTDNLPEAITAFDQKRKPKFTDEPRRGIYGS